MITCKEVVKKYGPIFRQGDVLRANDTAPEVVLNALGACQANDLARRASYQVVKCATLDNSDPFEFADQESPAQKPRTKVEYVKCELKSLFMYSYLFNDGAIYFDGNGDKDNKLKVETEKHLTQLFFGKCDLYRRTEVEIDWRDECVSYFKTTPDLHEDDCLIDLINENSTPREQKALLEMCRVALRATGELTPKP